VAFDLLAEKWKIDAVILAGGYAKRLWPLTLDKPKPLLPVAGKPIIDHVLERLAPLGSIMGRIVILTNSRFKSQLQVWAQGKKWQNIEVLSDGSRCEEEKPGATGSLVSIAETMGDNFLVIAGDCIYPRGLEDFVNYFHEKNAPLVGIYRANDKDQVRRGSTVQVDNNNIIVSFVEKPENPATDLVGAVVYAFPGRIKNRLKEYSALDLPRDEPGRFIEWLHKKETIHGYLLDGVVWDIGTLKAYEQIDRMFSERRRT
jgi:glucose-1-phosphate thymidylyltransferase